mmetsp:Transcript_104/g.300  ORF Transcript_104/g.300 Transcript_104/m.300 type:complete len:816 (-) Transcript_104:154-2601(-)|eukprot:CAMPEP_0198731838 /NCGR_PEP_ID=MMETSP1475-20131203/32406_1 /TAXON_ID= ORGANISM="Unidentified sp., Strain CCMP1999" /NCGR_SAMPLE_ID=MMETSP1475 /ASSEMBLY_ACC=CAM_ASM_001111 /LENGTH=815 /DNA_ID=CAMNT_0044494851 /DNA_START=116 /DNA_END=2563 /DNA_ORIENTATION=-
MDSAATTAAAAAAAAAAATATNAACNDCTEPMSHGKNRRQEREKSLHAAEALLRTLLSSADKTVLRNLLASDAASPVLSADASKIPSVATGPRSEWSPYQKAMMQTLLRKVQGENGMQELVPPAHGPSVEEKAQMRVGDIGLKAIDTLRVLAADTVENAKSGHPGMPMGMAPAAFVVWDRHLRFNPQDPEWLNRDRFVLSAGHGSVLLYSLLHLFGYSSVSMDDLKEFRQYGSRTPGHPENDMTPGVEVMTGALGQGISNAVGMALAEKHLAATYNQPDAPKVVDHFTYCIVGDGCLMEGISSEACSLAAHWQLGKLIVLYDDNSISIDGPTNIAFTEDVAARYRAYGWHVLEIHDGNRDIAAIDDAIIAAKLENRRPSLIKVRTTIGYGAPTKAGGCKIHGSALGEKELEGLREKLGWNHSPFEIPDDVTAYTRRKQRTGATLQRRWNQALEVYSARHPKTAALFKTCVAEGNSLDADGRWEQKLISAAEQLSRSGKATRHLSQAMLNAVSAALPGLIGGSADLESSCMTKLKDCGDFQANEPRGRNLHFGVREHAMGGISNGLALYGGGLIPFCATFLVFSDYMRNAVRTAALSGARVLFVMTHDSVLLGEDGPTHQPIEHLASFRAMPNINVMRPADALESAACYATALSKPNMPSMLVFSRQNVSKEWAGDYQGARRGAYVAFEAGSENSAHPDILLIATGSEVGLAVEAASRMSAENGSCHVRVVSVPCVEEFERQDESYKRQILPFETPLRRRLVVEAASSFGWHKYASNFQTVDGFGVSAPAADVAEHFQLTVDGVYSHAMKLLDEHV